MKLDNIVVAGVSLPIPAGWRKAESTESYVGKEGLLDPRVGDLKDNNEIERIRHELERFGGTMDSVVLQGRPCVRTRYNRDGASIRTYSIDLGGGWELRAVYVFRAGNEAVVAAVAAQLESDAAMSGES